MRSVLKSGVSSAGNDAVLTPRSISRRHWLALSGMAGAAACLPCDAAEESTTKWLVDPNKVITPKFRGWGTSLAWWARVAGAFPDETLDRLLDLIFGKDGLRLNIVRYNIGGGESPDHHSLSYRAAVEGYLTKDGAWNWNADAGQRKVLMKSLKMGVDFTEAFSNSPPWWMTHSGSVAGDKDGRGNLRDDMIGPFTDYLATVVRYFRDKAGVEFDTLAPLNEPLGNWWKLGGPQEGCVIPPEQQAKLMPVMRTALDRLGIRTLVTGPEDNRTSQTITSLSAYPKAAWNAIAHVNTHTYHAEDRAALRRLAEKHEKPIWVSEYGDGDANGFPLARTIIADLRDLHAKAWIYWQAIDAGGWGLINHSAFNHRKTAPTAEQIPRYTLNPKFHVMRLFTHYLKPGCKIVESNQAGTVAGFDPESRTLSIIVLNEDSKEKSLILELPNGSLKGKSLSGEIFDGTETKALPPVLCETANQTLRIPPRSMAAFKVTRS